MFETCYARDLTLKRVDLTTHIKNRLVFLAAPPAVAQHLGDCVLQVREEGGDGGLVVAMLQVHTHQACPLRVKWLLGYGVVSRNVF